MEDLGEFRSNSGVCLLDFYSFQVDAYPFMVVFHDFKVDFDPFPLARSRALLGRTHTRLHAIYDKEDQDVPASFPETRKSSKCLL